LRKNAAVHHSKNCALMSQMGHNRSFGDVGSMSGLPESGHGWATMNYDSTPAAACCIDGAMLWRLRSFPDFCEPCLPSPVEKPP
jgi:hypothetical protein